jgi:hypothetical protein
MARVDGGNGNGMAAGIAAPGTVGMPRLSVPPALLASLASGSAAVLETAQRHGGLNPRGWRCGSGKAGDFGEEGLQAAIAVANEFPPPLRLYVMFLEAADSHRLGANLIR